MSPEAFQFRFQKVLDLREQQQRALEIELGRLDGLLQKARADADRWEEERTATLQARAEARLGGDLDEDARQGGYLAYVRARLEAARGVVEEARRGREIVRGRLERVMQSCKMLENYRDRLRTESQADSERAEERIVELHTMHKFHQAKRAQ